MSNLLYAICVRQHCEGLSHVSPGVASSCLTCQAAYAMTRRELRRAIKRDGVIDDGAYSWNDCETCGTTVGGYRYSAHAIKGEELVHLYICDDCVEFLANGETPEEWP